MRKRAQKMMPASRLGRLIVGVLLVLGGILGFLPIVGFWMIPLGLIVLSVDFPFVRRFRRRLEVRIGRWWRRRQAQKASRAAKGKIDQTVDALDEDPRQDPK